MLDPRIYRTGLIAVALAVIVFAFSLQGEPGSVGTSLSPQAFNGADAYTTMTSLAKAYPNRSPGSDDDVALASVVAQGLHAAGFQPVSKDVFKARTVAGTRTLENVIGIRPGLTSGSIVVVAHRDAVGSPAKADMSGTAVLLELANVLAGQTQTRSVILASTSGSIGAAGAERLASQLPGPVDAVIVLGDLAGAKVTGQLIVPWSNSEQLAPPLLRNTLATAIAAQAGLGPGSTSLAGQLMHLAFPLAVGEQAPFNARGEPAVLLSVSGQRAPSPTEATSETQLTDLGQSVLRAVNALETAPAVPAPSAYLLLDGKVIPAWAIRLLVLALMLPVLLTTIDGVARASRRGYAVMRWVVWVLSAAMPFALAVIVVLLLRLVGLIGVAPPGPVAGTVPVKGGAIAALLILAAVVVLGFALLRRLVIAVARVPSASADRRGRGERANGGAGERANGGAAAGLLIVLCLISLLVWLANPFAALLLVPALHFWMWVVDPDVHIRREFVIALALAGLAAPALAALYCAQTLDVGPLRLVWSGILLLAGGTVGVVAALEWSIVLGCIASFLMITLRVLRQPGAEQAPITVRGPATYAGPGSLGGTQSALRR